MDLFDVLRPGHPGPKVHMPVICSDCQLEVVDPGSALNAHRCPRCSGSLMRLAVPEELGFDRTLPESVHLPS